MSAEKYVKVSVEGIDPERSTCGFRQRMIKKDDGAPMSITRLKTDDARPHWHKATHEYYYVLEGSGKMVVDGEEVPLKQGDCIWIKPGAMHHAVGELVSLIIASPAYDPADTFFDEPAGVTTQG